MRRESVLGFLMTVGALSLAATGAQGQPDSKVVQMQWFTGITATKRLPEPLDVMYSSLYLLSGGGGNALALLTDDGVVLVDTKLAGWSQPMLDKLKLITDKPVTTIINTHSHSDHTGSNHEFQTVVDIIAHENTKANMSRMGAFKGRNTAFLPRHVYTDKVSLLEGRNRLDLYYFGAGHTNGDTIVVLPAYGVAYVGDLFFPKAAPNIDSANGGSAVALALTLERAVAGIKDIDVVVPGHADPPQRSISTWFTWNDLREYAEFNRAFLEATQVAIKQGKSVDETVASLALAEKYQDYRMEHAKANVEAIYRELKK